MVIEWLYGLFVGVAGFFADIQPDWDVPAELEGAADAIESLVAPLAGFGAWAPFEYMGTCLTLSVGVTGVCLLIKVGLKAISHSPVSGGSG